MEGRMKMKLYPPAIRLYLGLYAVQSFTFVFDTALNMSYTIEYLKMSSWSIMMLSHASHIYFVWLMPIGAVIGDSYLGYWKQFIFSLWALVPVAILRPLAAAPPIGLPPYETYIAESILISLLDIMLVPTTLPLLGDQFSLPGQEELYSHFLLTRYWVSNIFNTLGQIIGPKIANRVQCFGRRDCYSLVYCLNFLLVVIRVCGFTMGWHLFRKNTPHKQNVFMKFVRLMYCAIKRRDESTEVKEHWLDYAEEDFDKKYIDDMKRLKMLHMLIPTLFISMLLTVDDTAFPFQAKRLNGNIGIINILPEQMYAVNAMFFIILIPIFQYAIYPLLKKKNLLTRRIVRVMLGGIMYFATMVYCTYLCSILETIDHPTPHDGEGQLRIFNNMDCLLNVSLPKVEDVQIEKMDFHQWLSVKADNITGIRYHMTCENESAEGIIRVEERRMMSYHVKNVIEVCQYHDEFEMDETSYPTIRTLFNTKEDVNYVYKMDDVEILKTKSFNYDRHTVYVGEYSLNINDNPILNYSLEQGGDYVLLIKENSEGGYIARLLVVHQPNQISVIWMIPEYIIEVIGEILYSISWKEFLYTQSPVNMKSFVEACDTLSKAIGNFIVLLVEIICPYKSWSKKLFAYSGLILLNLILLGVLIKYHKDFQPANKTHDVIEEEKKQEEEEL